MQESIAPPRRSIPGDSGLFQSKDSQAFSTFYSRRRCKHLPVLSRFIFTKNQISSEYFPVADCPCSFTVQSGAASFSTG